MTSSLCTSNVTSGCIDLATFDELEKYMYGGPDATAYFVRETRKATWFTQVPVCLSRATQVLLKPERRMALGRLYGIGMANLTSRHWRDAAC